MIERSSAAFTEFDAEPFPCFSRTAFSSRKYLKKSAVGETGKSAVRANCEVFHIIALIYGDNIPQVSWDAQTRVREACMSRCGVHLKEINIHVQGVDMPGETEASEGEQEERIEKHEQN